MNARSVGFVILSMKVHFIHCTAFTLSETDLHKQLLVRIQGPCFTDIVEPLPYCGNVPETRNVKVTWDAFHTIHPAL